MNDVQKQETLNELRREILEYRAVRLNRWLQVVGFMLTFLAIALPLAGLIGFDEFREIKSEAEKLADQVETAQGKVQEMLVQVEEAEAKVLAQAEALGKHAETLGTVEEKMQQLAALAAVTGAVVGVQADPGADPAAVLSALGFDEFEETRSGVLGSEGVSQEEFSLPSAGEYWFTADCENCEDLDLVLYRDATTKERFDEDLLVDAIPVVRYEAATSEENVFVDVLMVECPSETCTWSLTGYLARPD